MVRIDKLDPQHTDHPVDMSLPGVAQMRGRASLRIAPRRTIRRRVRDRVTSFLGGSDLSFERNFLIVRPAIAALVALSVLIQGSGIPGRTGVFLGCGVAIAYNF